MQPPQTIQQILLDSSCRFGWIVCGGCSAKENQTNIRYKEPTYCLATVYGGGGGEEKEREDLKLTQ